MSRHTHVCVCVSTHATKQQQQQHSESSNPKRLCPCACKFPPLPLRGARGRRVMCVRSWGCGGERVGFVQQCGAPQQQPYDVANFCVVVVVVLLLLLQQQQDGPRVLQQGLLYRPPAVPSPSPTAALAEAIFYLSLSPLRSRQQREIEHSNCNAGSLLICPSPLHNLLPHTRLAGAMWP